MYDDLKGDRDSEDPMERVVWQLNQIRQILMFVVAVWLLGGLFLYVAASGVPL